MADANLVVLLNLYPDIDTEKVTTVLKTIPKHGRLNIINVINLLSSEKIVIKCQGYLLVYRSNITI